jgi:phage shock protein A
MALESIRQQLRQKEADIARLRGQRDVLKEENEMRKAQQAVSSQSVKEVDEFARFQEVSRTRFSVRTPY